MQLGPMQKRFVDALRSGEYIQGRLELYNKGLNAYCCLGVANTVCELGEKSPIFLERTYNEIGLNNPNGRLSESVKIGETPYISLLAMNDAGKMSFKDIGDFIEANPELVFTRSI